MAQLSPIQKRLQEAVERVRLAQAQKGLANAAAQETDSQETNKETGVSAQNEPNEKSAEINKIISRTLSAVQQVDTTNAGTDRFGKSITYNTRQAEAIQLISTGKSCVVIGAAGTGKTTIQKGATQALIQGGLGRLNYSDHKYLKSDSYGIVICAYTRRATNNIRKNLSEDLQQSCITIHKLLEYEPTEVYITDPTSGERKKSMRFEPKRVAENPLPASIKTIIIEESSMVSRELFQEIRNACQHEVQFVFLGDIQQLPPVFGSAILGYKMLELPVVELTEVYRQALDSPIISLAHRILSGNPIKSTELKSFHVKGKLTLHPWVKRIEADSATETLAKFFVKAIEQGTYDPEQHGILIPFNKSCGTDELNKHIATKLAQHHFRAVFEIIHGWKKSYYSVGDKCLFEREDAIIKEIYPNPQYTGIPPREASHNRNYWGHKVTKEDEDIDISDADDADSMDQFLQTVVATDDSGEVKKRAASHCIKLELLDSEREITISSAGDIDALILGYAITVHKSQGSEWPKVFLCFHHTHATMLQRELLYTAVTRAREELFCICEPDTFEKGIVRQRIKGNTWQEKAEFFKGKIDNEELQS